MKPLNKKFLWSISPYLVDPLSLNFGYGGHYEIAIFEILTRGQEDKGLQSTSLLSISFHRMRSTNKFHLYLWDISILFTRFNIMKKLF